MTWFMAGTLLLLGVVMILVPTISRATVPLGVDVPRDRVDDPVVRAALLRYRIAGSVATLLGLLAVVVTRGDPVWIVLLVLAWVVVFVVCRGPIIRAKAEQRWYADRQVRVGASVSGSVRRQRPLWVLHVLALLLGLASAIATAIRYPSLPDPYPMHWDADGQVNRWAAKTWESVLIPSLMAMAMAILVAAIAWGISRRRDPQLPDGDPTGARRLAARTDRIIQVLLGVLNVTSALVLAATALLPLVGSRRSAAAGIVLLAGVLAFVPAVWAVAAAVRAQRKARDRAHDPAAADSPDDDAYWKLGLLYYNPADPSFLVPKRSGIGYTVNVGHPAGMAVMVVAGLGVLAAILLPAVTH